jgi:hypothetical protein
MLNRPVLKAKPTDNPVRIKGPAKKIKSPKRLRDSLFNHPPIIVIKPGKAVNGFAMIIIKSPKNKPRIIAMMEDINA